MIGDELTLLPEYLLTAEALFQSMGSKIHRVVAIGGESGSGKSITAVALQQVMAKHGIVAGILHQDDYFHLPPASNHQARLKSLGHVGLGEVNLDLLQQHIHAFIHGQVSIEKPLVDYSANAIGTEELVISDWDCLLVEGTYVLALNRLDCRVFMKADYHSTRAKRAARGRDPEGDFVEQVLEIEHRIIQELGRKADLYIDSRYQIYTP